MAAISMVLGMVAVARMGEAPPDVSTASPTQPSARPNAPREQSASELDSRLADANKLALAAAMAQVGPLLDAAYKPVYDKIPEYADYHYSVWGEYAELGTAAIGNVGAKLKEMLFEGLDGRLREVGVSLDNSFNSRFETELKASGNEAGSSAFGQLTSLAIEDAMSRMIVTLPVSSAAAIGTATTIKVAATVVAKKIAAKLAVKAAAKTGGKWAATGTGAGVGAAACWWAGPGAGLCAAAGGVGAWIIADYGIVKLDEYWNRDEFEADLRAMINEQKAAQEAALGRALYERANSVRAEHRKVVQRHDFTLRELSGVGNVEMCEAVKKLLADYEPMRMNLRARTPEAMERIQTVIAENWDSLSLGPTVRELDDNLRKASTIRVSEMLVDGNLPQAFRADRKVSGLLRVDGESFPLGRNPASKESGFMFKAVVGKQVSVSQPLSISLAIEQHLRLWGNKYFGGAVDIDVLESLGSSNGVEHRIRLQLEISNDPDAESVYDARPGRSTEAERISLSVRLVANPMAKLQTVPQCE